MTSTDAIQTPNLLIFGDVFNYFVYLIEATNLKKIMIMKSSSTDETMVRNEPG